MYDITIDGNTLYHPNSTEYNIISGVINEELNDAGYMELKIPYSNPAYDAIVERKSKIIVFKDNMPLWYGEVRDVSKDFSKNKDLYIVGEAAFLNDTVQPQRKISGTRFQVLQAMLDLHNNMIEVEKHFQPGAIGKNANEPIEIVTDWEHTLDAIRKHLCGEEEYFRIRHVNGVRYLDIMPLDMYGKRSEQDIMFGENLLDYSEESTGADIATVCIPLGTRLEDGGIEGYQNYLTCESANNGKNYVELPTAISRLGHITKVVKFEDVTDANTLLTLAVNYLREAQYATLTLNLTAIDLSILHSDIDNYAVGDYVHAICEPLGMDAWFPVRKHQTDIVNIANDNIKIGSSGIKSVTKQSAEGMQTLEQKMPNKDDILTAALKNASALINANGDNGHVSIRIDKDGKPYEIVVMDADTLENSTRAWRWNLSGFGHGTKQAGESEFTWSANVALTMDGAVVAEKGNIGGFNIYTKSLIDGVMWDYLSTLNDKVRLGCRHDGSFGQIWINGERVTTTSDISDMMTYSAFNNWVTNNLPNYVKSVIWIYLKYVFQGPQGKSLEDASTGDIIFKKYNLE